MGRVEKGEKTKARITAKARATAKATADPLRDDNKEKPTATRKTNGNSKSNADGDLTED